MQRIVSVPISKQSFKLGKVRGVVFRSAKALATSPLLPTFSHEPAGGRTPASKFSSEIPLASTCPCSGGNDVTFGQSADAEPDCFCETPHKGSTEDEGTRSRLFHCPVCSRWVCDRCSALYNSCGHQSCKECGVICGRCHESVCAKCAVKDGKEWMCQEHKRCGEEEA